MRSRSHNYVFRSAQSYADILDGFRIVYNAYVRRGYCEPNLCEIFYTRFSLLPDTKTFVIERENAIVGTISTNLDFDSGLPMEAAFYQDLERLRSRGMKLGEISSLTLDNSTFGQCWILTQLNAEDGSPVPALCACLQLPVCKWMLPCSYRCAPQA